MRAQQRKILYFTLPVLVLLAAVVYLLFIPKGPLSRLKGTEELNYIIISVDTLRADRLGCYGFSEVKTPTIDMFASRGVKFEQCVAQTPLTLPSHTSLLTGTYPTYHGVRDNGGFLVPQEMHTLAELMKQSGYETSAFVAAYVLDSKWGWLYDPHTPYDPPSPYSEIYPNRPYIGEIAYTDSQIARLWDYLEDARLAENSGWKENMIRL